MRARERYWLQRVKRRRFLGAVGIGAATAAIAAACGGDTKEATRATTAPPAGASPAAQQQPAGARPVRGGTLTGLLERDIDTFDPTRSQSTYTGIVFTLTVDSMFEVDKDGNSAGRLVERTENPQPNIYVLTLRRGIKFQDGSDLTAEAVKFNLEWHINDPKSVIRQNVKDITAVETPDPATVRITLKAPFAPFALNMPGVLNPAAVRRLGENLNRDLTGAGSGPFKFVEWKRDTQIVLERNEHYWRKDADGAQLPYVDRVILRPFPDDNVRLLNLTTGDADVLIGPPPYKDVEGLRKNPDLVVQEITGSTWYFLILNTEKEPFNHPAARRALSYAIDREQIKKTVFFNTGKVLDTPVQDTIPWATAESHPYLKRDLAKAKQELAAAGKPNGFKFVLQAYNASPEWLQLAELIKDSVREVGLDAEIQLYETTTVVDNGNKGNFQAILIRSTGGGFDPDSTLYTFFYTNTGYNLAKYSNPALDRLLDEGRATLDRDKRGPIYRQAQRILYDDQPFAVFWQAPQISVVRKHVQNYPQTRNGFWGTRDYDRIWKAK